MKKILFFLHFTKIGGAELIAMQYIEGLIKNGYTVDLIVDYNMGKDGNTFEHAIPKEANFQYVKSERISKFIYKLRTLGKKNILFNIPLLFAIKFFDFYYYNTKIKSLINRNNYDLSITFFQFLPSHITKFKHMKHFIWLHGSVNQMFSGKKALLKNSFGKKLNLYDKVFTIAEEMKDEVINLYPFINKNKIELLYNPFDFESIKSKANQTTNLSSDEINLLKDNYFCTVTRLDENQKDLTTLIESYKILLTKNQITEKLYIIGDGIDKVKLQNLVESYGLNKSILFLGKKTNPFVWMQNSKAFILSSKFEGLPTVLIEAMILEKFVISSNCKTGPCEILDNGKCGDLFEIGDVKELSNLLLKTTIDSQHIINKVVNSKNHIEKFKKENIIENLIKILEEKR
ncbi:glycosyltransferase, family 4 [Arcobacter acticola]|uniref:Glycosyltransferase, family 4 n=1 Tax=Arcobacter acticola TaxID=1849015 RepID=A0A6M8EYN4_9BACT|nr:glycosyltransferase [Arcobacter acticola]QKE29657.1 glycosyltransferase, family 4 [Arcobacter acticola]